jgi:hypothetical protein
MKVTQFAKWCGVSGVLVGFLFMGFYYWVYSCNPFHFPVGQEPNTGNIEGQAFARTVDDVMWYAVPGLVLQVFTIWSSWLANVVVWVIAALLNGPIYYCAGLLLGVVAKGCASCYAKVMK